MALHKTQSHSVLRNYRVSRPFLQEPVPLPSNGWDGFGFRFGMQIAFGGGHRDARRIWACTPQKPHHRCQF